MKAGKLRDRIKLYHVSNERDSFGEDLLPEAHYACVPAEQLAVSVAERYAVDQTVAATMQRFSIRYREDVKDSDRLEFRGTMYSVISVQPTSAYKRELVLVAAEDRGVASVRK